MVGMLKTHRKEGGVLPQARPDTEMSLSGKSPRKTVSQDLGHSLWEAPKCPSSYWILVMSCVDQHQERAAARELLQWREFTAQQTARAVCITSLQENFRPLVVRFGISSFPTLLVSDSRNMSPALILKPKILESLLEKPGSFRNFLTRLHIQIDLEVGLSEIARHMEREESIKKLKTIYSEVKSLVTISIQPPA